MSKNVLVTGGAGYVGSHVCKALAKEGFLPITYDNLSRGHEQAVKWGPLIKGDLLDSHTLNKTLAFYRPSAVFHFAAYALVSESVRYPELYYKNNVEGTLSLLDAMLRNSVHFLIFSSSCATYGNPLSLPISENHLQNPTHPYGKSKWIIEEILKDFSQNLSFSSLRYFNAAGADLEGEIGENHELETHLIPLLCQTGLELKPSLDIYGTDFPTPDGTAIRDYIHVNDLARAHLKAFFYLLEQKKSVFLNLGTGNGFSVLEVLHEAEKIFRKKIPHQKKARREGDPAILVADSSKAKDLLQWSPKDSDLSTLLTSAWNWHQKLFNLQKLSSL